MENIKFTQANLQATFLPTGDLFELSAAGMMLNQLNGNPLDGSLNQLYLRVHTASKIVSAPLIGSNSDSSFSIEKERLVWMGRFENVAYQVVFTLGPDDVWFWQVDLSGNGEVVDVIYGQDLGVAAKGAIQANEAYVSQYLDHKVFNDAHGYKIVSRQNQAQAGTNPAVQLGSLQPVAGFSTDGHQFFGKNYTLTGQPDALAMEHLPSTVYQYEFAYVALQTEKMRLQGGAQVVFYGKFVANHPEAVTRPLVSQAAITASFHAAPIIAGSLGEDVGDKWEKLGPVLSGLEFDEQELATLYPVQTMVEKQAGAVLSFFAHHYHHVVLQKKELLMERSHGHILLSGTDLSVDRPPLSTTVYMHGLFNSQIVLGNTSMNKLMSNSRNALNLMKHSGQRFYLKVDGLWRCLGLASAFEMGLNSATWYYKLADDVLKITTFSLADEREVQTRFVSEKGRTYDVLVTNHLLMSNDEVAHYDLAMDDKLITVTAAKTSPIVSEYPELTYYFKLHQDFTLTDERALGVATATPELVAFLFNDVTSVDLTVQGSLEGAAFVEHQASLAHEDARYLQFINGLLRHFELRHESEDVESINTLARWYTHNMLVHYLSPHGLEQYGGAAWGTRDVSQGPTEYFLALNHPEVVADIIGKVYANQFNDDGNWPQWFMFDRYDKQKADESHGDVIVWPMKIVADYLLKTNDVAILQQKIPYTDRTTFNKTIEKVTLLDHIKKEIAYIENNFLEGTALSCYGDGDWDDTLQPNDARLKKQMSSSWTVALTYQVVNELANVLVAVDQNYSAHLKTLATSIKKDYNTYILSSEVIPGFIIKKGEQTEYIIHPTDKKTGIQYRLLPMTRGMIAELLTTEQVEKQLQVINDHLKFPDGVRLMNRPANYQGGVSTYFKRAEQSANFGREIGLQYVHAHIRYTEAMAKIGNTAQTWAALETINPILIQEHVPNAALRQANVYFSSSDGAFKDRYEAHDNFAKLKTGEAAVKGGWRIYSSGPGIFMNQLLSNVLGMRSDAGHYIFDPVLPNELNGLRLTYQLGEKNVTICYHLGEKEAGLYYHGEKLATQRLANPYRQGALAIEKSALDRLLAPDDTLELYI